MPTTRRLILAFAAVYLIWGSTYLAILFAIETLPTFLMIGVRFVVGGLIMIALARITHPHLPWPTRTQWRDTTIIGILLMGGGTGTVAWAEHRIPSSVAALLVATLPIWMLLFESVRTRTRHFTLVSTGGIGVGLFGVSLVVNPASALGDTGIDLAGAIGVLSATMLWALGSIYARHVSLPSPAYMTAGMQTLCGGTFLVLLGLVIGESRELQLDTMSAKSLLALLYLIVFGNIGFLAYSWLLKATTPARVSTYAYVNPVIAVILGWLLAGENLSTGQLGGAALIIISVVMIISRKEPRPRINETIKELG